MVAGMALRAVLPAHRFESGNQPVFQRVGGALKASGKSVDRQRRSVVVTYVVCSRPPQNTTRGQLIFIAPVHSGGFSPFRFGISEARALASCPTDGFRRGAAAGGLLSVT